jgi:hypothetical protein
VSCLIKAAKQYQSQFWSDDVDADEMTMAISSSAGEQGSTHTERSWIVTTSFSSLEPSLIASNKDLYKTGLVTR